MGNMREVKLELLRAGPAHNQLLSPLTPYIALCGDGGPVTFYIQMEHHELLNRLQRLRYFYVDEQTKRVGRVDDRSREAELEELGRFLGNVLGEVKTLSPELRSPQEAEHDVVNLRLVFSGSELALLPFEMAIAPQGFPGEGAALLLQSNVRICMTREVRRGQPLPVAWDRPPRILFAYAAPGGLSVPHRAHLHAVRLALEPWVRWEVDARRRAEEAVKPLVTVLPDASVEAIRAHCAERQYTHVHILAHGDHYEKIAGERRYGLALSDPSEPGAREVVSGNRLAQALRATRADGSPGSRPSVVSLMTCDSGNQASVLSPGGSIAHELHAHGIPWVFASQFPLTKAGSVLITESLYRGLLKGDDPRYVLRDIRNILCASSGRDHDWTSLVSYASLPPEFADELAAFRDRQRRKAIEVAFDRAERSEERTITDAAIEDIRRRLDEWEGELPRGDDHQAREQQAECYGMRGAMEKRVGLLLYDRERAQEGQAALREARDYYTKAMDRLTTNHWTATQYLSLSAVLSLPAADTWWVLARYGAEKDSTSLNPETKAWAHGTLAELEMLEVVRQKPADVGVVCEIVRDHCRAIVQLMGKESFAVSSTRRQFERYRSYWRDARWNAIVGAALEVFGDAPSEAELPPDRR